MDGRTYNAGYRGTLNANKNDLTRRRWSLSISCNVIWQLTRTTTKTTTQAMTQSYPMLHFSHANSLQARAIVCNRVCCVSCMQLRELCAWRAILCVLCDDGRIVRNDEESVPLVQSSASRCYCVMFDCYRHSHVASRLIANATAMLRHACLLTSPPCSVTLDC